MQPEKRKVRRRPMRYAAWLSLAPDELKGCALSDISELGARIDVDDETVLPDRFFLFLSSSGDVRRACQVVWRKPRQVGVKFMRPYGAREAMPKLVPADPADAPEETAESA